MSQGRVYTQVPMERVQRRVADASLVALQAYVPARLRREVKQHAAELGITVSELVRQLLVIGLESALNRRLSE